MSHTFGSSDANDFELPDADTYLFHVTAVNVPQIRLNSFYDQWVADYEKRKGVAYDHENDPLNKKEESNTVIECTVRKAVSGDDEWAGSMIRFYSSCKPGNEMGSVEYPTRLRLLTNAVLGRTLENGELMVSEDRPVKEGESPSPEHYDGADPETGELCRMHRGITNGYFIGTYVHKMKKDGSGIRGEIAKDTLKPYKAQGSGQGGRRRQQTPPPPPPSVPTDEEFDPAEFEDAEMTA